MGITKPGADEYRENQRQKGGQSGTEREEIHARPKAPATQHDVATRNIDAFSDLISSVSAGS